MNQTTVGRQTSSTTSGLDPRLTLFATHSSILYTVSDIGICTGGLARAGLRPGLSRARARAEITPPERHPCPCSGCAGFFVFFARRTSAPKKVDRFQIDPRCQRLRPPFSHISSLFSILFMATSRRLQNRAAFHIFSSTADHLSSR